MTSTNPVFLPPDRETPVFFDKIDRFYYRTAYARSADCRTNNEPGQDYLTYRIEGGRFAFALCDGVSQSFYGDLAARILGDWLLAWIDKLDFRQPHREVEEALRQGLNALTDDASLQVRDFLIPEHISPMLRAVLEKKRVIGSESTFIAGLIDIPTNAAIFAWMGDSRLRLWHGARELTAPFAGLFKTSERWSTVKGPVGEAHLAFVALTEFDHLAVYSDGFSYLDDAYKTAREGHAFSHRAINEFMAEAALRPSSDDISFLEIWTTPTPPKLPKEGESLVAPILLYSHRNQSHFLSWQPVTGASEYEIRFSSGNGTTLSSLRTDACAWQGDAAALDANIRLLSARAWQEGEPGPWSDFLHLEQPVAAPQRQQTGPLPPLPTEPVGVSTSPMPPTAPVTAPYSLQAGSLRPAPVISTPSFSSPPIAAGLPPRANPQPAAPIPSFPAQQPLAKRSNYWAWGGLAILLLFCLAGTMGVMALGGSGTLAIFFGKSPSETPEMTATKNRTPKAPIPSPSITITKPAQGNHAPPDTQSPTTTITPTLTETDMPIETETMTPTLTPASSPTSISSSEGQSASIKEAVQFLPYPNLQYSPSASSPIYEPGVEITILKKYSAAGVDWYYMRAKDGLEGWVMGEKLNLEGINLQNIPLDGQVVFPPLTPVQNP